MDVRASQEMISMAWRRLGKLDVWQPHGQPSPAQPSSVQLQQGSNTLTQDKKLFHHLLFHNWSGDAVKSLRS